MGYGRNPVFRGVLYPFCNARLLSGSSSPAAEGGKKHPPSLGENLPSPDWGLLSPSAGNPQERRNVRALPRREKRPVPAGHIPPTLQRLFMKNLAIPSPVRYNKTTRRGKAFTSRISLTALSTRKAPRPYGQPGQMPKMATLLPY